MTLTADPLLEVPAVNVAANLVQPVWLTLQLPSGAAPGIYSGSLTVQATSGAEAVFDDGCFRQRTDVNCDGATDVLDVVTIVNVAFRGTSAGTAFCNPCP
jgi:hypothetical protein